MKPKSKTEITEKWSDVQALKTFRFFWNTSIDEFITVGVYQCRWGVTYSENTFPCQPPQIWPFTMKTLQERCIRTLFFFSETPAVLINNWTACGATVEVAVCGRWGLRKTCGRKILRCKKCSPRVPHTLPISCLWFAFWTKEKVSKRRLQ